MNFNKIKNQIKVLIIFSAVFVCTFLFVNHSIASYFQLGGGSLPQWQIKSDGIFKNGTKINCADIQTGIVPTPSASQKGMLIKKSSGSGKLFLGANIIANAVTKFTNTITDPTASLENAVVWKSALYNKVLMYVDDSGLHYAQGMCRETSSFNFSNCHGTISGANAQYVYEGEFSTPVTAAMNSGCTFHHWDWLGIGFSTSTALSIYSTSPPFSAAVKANGYCVTGTDNCASVTDVDGNSYQTVQIGNQCWFKENLKTTKYKDNTVISNVTNNTIWAGLTTGAYACYQNNSSNCATYGALYNWYAVSNSAGLCPTGWHVPTDEEFKTLEINLGMTQNEANSDGSRGCDIGYQLMEESTSNIHNYNSSGFTSKAVGMRWENGNFMSILDNPMAYFWASSPSVENLAWYRSIMASSPTVYRSAMNKKIGMSVRCVKDIGIVETPTISPNDSCVIYQNPINVILSTQTPGAIIRYTLDGSQPTESSPIYTNPITISASTTIIARAYKPGWTPSNTINKRYRIEPTWTYCASILSNGVYHISQPDHLNCMRIYLNGSFVLDNDIDLSGINFEPIGSSDCPFGGSFNGQNKKIKNLYISQLFYIHYGLFGYTSAGSIINNLNLQDVDIYRNGNSTAATNVGSLVGVSYGTVDNCHSSGNIYYDFAYTDKYLGGLIALNYGNISNSSFVGSVSGLYSVGGFVSVNNGNINNSYAEGSVQQIGPTGGSHMAGFVHQNNGTIDQSHFNGSVSGSTPAGFASYNTGTINNSFSDGYISGSAASGFIYSNNGTIQNSHSNCEVVGDVGVGGFVTHNGSLISKCYSTGNVSGLHHVGGFVAYNGYSAPNINSSSIEYCYSTGNVSVTGTGPSGGFAGYLLNNASRITSSIKNSYSTGNLIKLTGPAGLAGFLGYTGDTWGHPRVENCYSTGMIVVENPPTNRGFSTTALTNYANNFWDIQTSGQSSSPVGATGKETYLMKQEFTFTNWDFSTIWDIDSCINNGYPYLINNPPQPENMNRIVIFDANGGDIEANPQTKTVICGGNVETLPTPPTKTGYTFVGWNTQADGNGTTFTASTPVITNITVYAKWVSRCLLAPGNSGSGTPEDPKIITTPEQLNGIRDYLDCAYKLGNDINLDHATLSANPAYTWYDDTLGWLPIGTNHDFPDFTPQRFTGRLDGDNHTISNLYINDIAYNTGTHYNGLFSIISPSHFLPEVSGDPNTNYSVKDLNLSNVNINSQSPYRFVGSLAGMLNHDISTENNTVLALKNIRVSGSIRSVGDLEIYIGGLVGETRNNVVPIDLSTPFHIDGVYSSVDINNCSYCSSESAGGIVGYNMQAYLKITNSVFDGTISAYNKQSGGIIEGSQSNNVEIDNCYSVGYIYGHNSGGGIFGRYYYSNIQVNNSYSASVIDSINLAVFRGGFYGKIFDPTTANFNNNFWDIEQSGQINQGVHTPSYTGITGKTTLQMKQQFTFTNWDFWTTWAIDSNINNGYPYLINNPPPIN